MLYRTFVSPSVFEEIPDHEQEKRIYCLCTNQLLESFLDNSVVLVGSDTSGKNAAALDDIRALLNIWPDNQKKKAAKIIKRLIIQNRFVEAGSSALSPSSPRHDSCKCLPDDISAFPRVPVVVGRNCCTLSCSALNISPVTVYDYLESDILQERKECRECHVADKEWTMRDFEEEVLIPIFKHSKHIKLIDRYIGRSIVSRKNGKLSLRKFSKSYEYTIGRIISLFSRETSSKRDKTFEIYTGIQAKGMSETDLIEAKKAIACLEKSLASKYSFPIKIIAIKEKNPSGEQIGPDMPHERYIITDQIALNLGRSFDFVRINSGFEVGDHLSSESFKIRDMHVILTQDKVKRKVEAEVRTLPVL